MSTAVARVHAALEAHGCNPKPDGHGWTFRCPAHEDNRASGKLDEGSDGRALLHCHAGCPVETIVAGIVLTMPDLFPDGRGGGQSPRPTPKTSSPVRVSEAKHPPNRRIVATYDYTDGNGNLLFQTVRYEPKDFMQRRPDGDGWVWNLKDVQRVLYQLPAVLATIADGGTVYVCEGEKDCDVVNALDGGHVATCNPMGAGSWRPEYSEVLRGARVVIVQDKDDTGRKHAREVAEALRGIAARVEIREAAEGKDAADHLAAGRTLADLVPMPVEPSTPPSPAVETWRSADVLDMLTAKPRPVPFLVDRLLARQELALLTAQPKDGKTWLVVALAVDLALGRPALELFETTGPCRVLLADEEMGYGKLQRRLQRIVKGAGLSEADIATLAGNLNLRPQQGMTFTTDEGIAALAAAVTEFRPDVLLLDSFAAFTSGIDDGNPERRRFYGRALAPLKQAHNLAVLMTAHPPLPSKEQHADARKRPRGGGDILAVADRALYVEKVSEELTEHGRTVTVTLGELFSREAGGLDGLCTVTIADIGPDSTAVKAISCEPGGLAGNIGKVNTCALDIMHALRLQPEREIYQPTLKADMDARGYRHTVTADALRSLVDQRLVEVLPARPGKSGKWIRLAPEEPE